jgi:hypothetical protein
LGLCHLMVLTLVFMLWTLFRLSLLLG